MRRLRWISVLTTLMLIALAGCTSAKPATTNEGVPQFSGAISGRAPISRGVQGGCGDPHGLPGASFTTPTRNGYFANLFSTVNGKAYAIHFRFAAYTHPGSYELSEAAGDQINVFELPIGNTGHYWDGGDQSQHVTIGPDQRSGELQVHLRAVFDIDPFNQPGPSVASNGPSLNIEGAWSC